MPRNQQKRNSNHGKGKQHRSARRSGRRQRTSQRRDPLNTVVLAYDGLCTFEFGIAIELFGLPRPEFDPWYHVRVAAIDNGQMGARGGFQVDAPYTLRALDTAGTIVVPGWRAVDADVPTALCRKLHNAHAAGARILSFCSGVFVLAAAGLLDNRRATTHWKYAEKLAQRYPQIDVNPDVLFVDEGNLLTSAGSAAGIDMGLYLVRRDFGAATANALARHLVVPPSRAGGQKQFIDTPVADSDDRHDLSELLDNLRSNLDAEHNIERMAKRVHMSKRTFARKFKAVTGMTPHRWLQAERVRRAQELLETTSMPLAAIARRSGFSDVQLLRLHFRRVVGNSPAAYRRSFMGMST